MTETIRISTEFGILNLYKRERSRFWQCATYLDGKNWRQSTGESDPNLAEAYGRKWQDRLVNDIALGRRIGNKKFVECGDVYLDELELLARGKRSDAYIDGQKSRLIKHLVPFFGHLPICSIKAGDIVGYRQHRQRFDPAPAASTIHQEIVVLRQVFKCAVRKGWLDVIPELADPYGAPKKIGLRPRFDRNEISKLIDGAKSHEIASRGKTWEMPAAQLHDFIVFMLHTGLRPDEANRLAFGDVQIVDVPESNSHVLQISVAGKRGAGICWSLPEAALAFERISERERNSTGDKLVFPVNHKKQFYNLLNRLKLREDAQGRRRTTYSLRHSYICERLLSGADIYQIAKNCRTSVDMIEKHYARHISTVIDLESINR